jgi:integrase
MPQMHFTARWVEAVKPPAEGQVDYFDTSPPGVGLRVAPSGRKTWFVMYRVHGRLRRLTLGTHPALTLADARSKALAVKHAVAQGEDPATEKQQARRAPLFEDIAEQYLEKYAKVHKKSWRADARLLHKEILPAWGKRQAVDIARRDVIALLDGLVERGAPIQSNRVLALVRKVFNWAISRDILEYSPCIQVKAPGKEHQRDRVLKDDEIRAVWDAFGQLDPVVNAYFKVRLLTAQRGGEVRLMRWEDIELDRGWWTIPAQQTKNGLAHRVPLSALAQDILQTLHRTSVPGPWVFPSPRLAQQPIGNVTTPALRLVSLSGVTFVSHDLRRTAASHMTSMGIPRLVVGKILNHVEPGVTKVYDRHSYDAEKRQALDAWGRKVMALIAGERGKVIPLRREVRE